MEMPNKKKIEQVKERFLNAYDSYGDDVFALLFSKLSNRDVALDLTQDVFLAIWEYMSAGKKIYNLRAFTFRTARNKLTDYYRRHKSLSLDSALEDGLQFSDDGLGVGFILARAEADFTLRALSAMSPHHYQIIQMRMVDNMTLDEIAFSLGLNKSTVSVRLHRAIKEAQHYLNKTP